MDHVCGGFDGGGEGSWGVHVGDESEGKGGGVGLDGGRGKDSGFLGCVADCDADGVVGAEGDDEGAEADVAGCAGEEDGWFGGHGGGGGVSSWGLEIRV